jgi:N,N-dimethylformamidase
MLPITGYADRWSVRQGEAVRFMIGSLGGARFRARVARVICGDPNPAGPGYREVPMPSALDGEHPGEEQPVHLGSWVEVPALDLPPEPTPLALLATVWPTRLAAGVQVVLGWRAADGGASLTLGIGPEGAWCRLATPTGEAHLSCGSPLTQRAWHDIACRLDPAQGRLELAQAPRRARIDRAERAAASTPLPPGAALAGPGAVGIAAGRPARGAPAADISMASWSAPRCCARRCRPPNWSRSARPGARRRPRR